MQAPRLRIILGVVLLGTLLAGLMLASYDVSQRRMYQVDELENAYMVGVEAQGRQREFVVSASIFLLPLMPFTRMRLSSAELMDTYRLVFCCVMWLNIFLIARATRVPLRSPLGGFVLLAAATLAPLWGYGFEVRHDNLLLTGTLLLWCLGKPNGSPFRYGYVLVGALAVLMQFVAFKAMLYWAPLTAALLLLPHPKYREMHSRLALAVQCFVGAAVSLAAIYALYRHLNLWEDFVNVIVGGTAVASKINARDHDETFINLLRGSPFVLAATFSLLAVAFERLRTEGIRFFSWSSAAPETLLALGALGIFYINPTPFRYNLVPLVGLLMVASARLATELRVQLAMPEVRATFIAIFIACHLGPWAFQAQFMAHYKNDRQRLLMNLAEQLTDRKRDRVYAASGLVLTRDSIGYAWFLHMLNIELFYDGTYPTIRSMLAKKPASVFIASYRTDWLRGPDRRFVREHYVPLADDFWVLGGNLPSGSGTFNCIHPGRYQIDGLPGSLISVGGQPLPPDGIVKLKRGRHRLVSVPNNPMRVRWVGPKLGAVPILSDFAHKRLFLGNL